MAQEDGPKLAGDLQPVKEIAASLFPDSHWCESISEGLIVLDLESQLLHVNEKAAQLTNLSGEGAYALDTFLSRIIEEDRASFLQKMESSLFIEKGCLCDMRVINGDHFKPMLVKAIASNDQSLIRGTIQDLASDAELNSHFTNLRSLVEGINDSLVAIDKDGLITYWNSGAERLFDRKASEILGKPITLINPGFVIEGYYEMFLRGEKFTRKHWNFQKSGQELTIDVTAAPLANNDGEFSGVVGVSRDVTELLSTLKEQSDQKELAERTSRLKTDFLNNMSHEIRTPLNGIIGTVDLLSELDHNEEAATLLEMQKNSAYRLMETLNGILSMSKIESKSGLIKVEKVKLEETLKALTENFHSVAKKKNLELNCINPDPEIKILAHPGSLMQVLNNLVQNAIKFTDEGAVTVRVVLGEEQVYIRVEDTGAGVAPAFVPQLFEPFSQEDNNRQKELKGSGLGLSLVKKYVSLMGGSVSFEHNQPKGAVFIIKLSRAW